MPYIKVPDISIVTEYTWISYCGLA